MFPHLSMRGKSCTSLATSWSSSKNSDPQLHQIISKSFMDVYATIGMLWCYTRANTCGARCTLLTGASEGTQVFAPTATPLFAHLEKGEWFLSTVSSFTFSHTIYMNISRTQQVYAVFLHLTTHIYRYHYHRPLLLVVVNAVGVIKTRKKVWSFLLATQTFKYWYKVLSDISWVSN